MNGAQGSRIGRRRFGSLRTQLIFWNTVAIALLLGALGFICRTITLTFILQSVDRELKRGIGMFQRPPPPARPPLATEGPPFQPPGIGVGQFRPEPPPFPPGGERRREPRFPGHGPGPLIPPDANSPYRPRLFYAVGLPEWPNDRKEAVDVAALERALQGETLYTTTMLDGEPVRVLSAPGFDRRGRKGAVQNVYPLKEVYRAIAGVNTALLLLIPIGLLGAGWMGAALTTRILRRVQHMTQAAGRIGAEDFSRRLPVSGNDEFAELAETFNGLLGRLEGAYQGQKRLLELQRRFTADASHELKTPLTVIKGNASLALSQATGEGEARRAFQEIDAAADTMSQLVQDLLLLARSDSGQMGRDRKELLVREVLERAAAQARHAGSAPITLTIEPEPLTVTGNEAELVRLFRNLLDNAARHTPAEGRITVTARASQEQLVVAVADTGTGIAPEHLPHLGERFYRVDFARARPDGGTGLGLSICKGIVEAHQGTMTFESAPGQGTTVYVHLPRANTPLPKVSFIKANF
jgi:signal transduction histidine kinase